jgi:microcin C transport system substrate-binding protein
MLIGMVLTSSATVAVADARPAAAVVDWRHAAAWFGEARYPSGFTHFDWVNADAPKGGRVVMGVVGTYDSFNPLIARGRPPAGLADTGPHNVLYDRLLEQSADDATAKYGRLAEAVAVDATARTVTFRLRREAHWHDGVPITAGDVVFAFEAIRRHGSPTLKTAFRDVVAAVATGDHEVVFSVSAEAARAPSTALALGELFPLPRHYWSTRDVSRTTLEPPLGSGPYRIGRFRPPRYIEYERVDDYWGRDLPVNRGRHNFDTLRFDYFLSHGTMRETARMGLIDAGSEASSLDWATAYDIPSVHAGVLRKALIPVLGPVGTGSVAFIMNQRRPQFADVRVREAISLLLDHEWNRRVLFWGEYERVRSFFGGSPFESRGPPPEAERALLARFGDRVPARALTAAYTPSRTSGHGHERQLLARAYRLLDDAGFRLVDGVRVHPVSGVRLEVAILLTTPGHERIALPYAQRLARIGVRVTMRAVEASQYQARLRQHEFDIAAIGMPADYLPGSELRARFGSAAAGVVGGSNWAGIADPVVDALVEEVLAADSMPAMTTAGRALDRVLLWNFYVVPGFRVVGTRFVWWDRFGFPARHGALRMTFPDAWWYDPERSAGVDRWLSRRR